MSHDNNFFNIKKLTSFLQKDSIYGLKKIFFNSDLNKKKFISTKVPLFFKTLNVHLIFGVTFGWFCCLLLNVKIQLLDKPQLLFITSVIFFIYFLQWYHSINKSSRLIKFIQEGSVIFIFVSCFINILLYFLDIQINTVYLIPLLIPASIIAFDTSKQNTISDFSKVQKINKSDQPISIYLIFFFFLMIKAIPLILYSGSYLDEYLHIFSGISWIQTGSFAKFYNDFFEYTRGAYVSVLVGLYLKIFSFNILSAKLLPATLGALNFYLLYRLSGYILKGRARNLLMVLYSISYYVILNHFYIRMFVFYEFFLLLNLNLIANIQFKEYYKNISKYLSILCLILLNIFFIVQNELELYPIILTFCIYIAYLLHIHLKKSIKYYGIILLTLLSIPLVFKYGEEIFNKIFSGNIVHGNGNALTYINLFFKLNLPITLLFFYGIYKGILDRKVQIFFLTAGMIYLTHNIISVDYRNIRGILYFLPLFYLISVFALSLIKFNTFQVKIVYLLLILTTLINYPLKNLNKPGIQKEIDYFDFKKAFSYININCHGDFFVAMHAPYISYFYNTSIDGVFYITSDKNNTNFYLNNGEYRTVMHDVPSVTDPQFYEILKRKQNTCILVFNEYRHERGYIPYEIYNDLQNHYIRKDFEGIIIYKK